MCNLQISDFRIFNFSIFKISIIGLLWSKITIFIIEITLKLFLHSKYGWNNPNSGRLGLKCPKLQFLPALSISMLTLLFLLVYPVSLSYFILAVTMSSSGRNFLHKFRTSWINAEWYLLFCFGIIFAFQKLNYNNNNSNTAYSFYFNCSSELYF